MAKVSLLGATYTDVPAVELPDGDGGSSVFYENGGGSNVHVVEYSLGEEDPTLVDATYSDISGWLHNNELVVLYSSSTGTTYYQSYTDRGELGFRSVSGDIFCVFYDDSCHIISKEYAIKEDVDSDIDDIYDTLDQLNTDVSAKYTKPSTGIPSTDLASSVQTSLGNADTAYQKPSTGIPSTDLATSVQSSLTNADTAYQKPSTGIPATDLASGVQTSLTNANSAYQKPSTGIPPTDLASTVQTSLANADTAYQKPSTGIPSTDLASGVQTSLTNADSAYQKPVTGIPSTDLASSVQTSLSKADTAYQKPSTGIPASDLASGVIPSVPVQDVQVNGTSVLGAGGVANIVKATDAQVKAGVETGKILVPSVQDASTFYGLAKAAGSDEKNSSLAVGTYTDAAKSAISQMLNAPVSVSGTTPAITGLAGVRYVCGECATLSIVAPESGCVDVVFTSGSTATVLTVTSAKANTTIKWANGFDPTSLEANTVYEINILDGEYGVVGSWT